jgi:hypothetical protein
MLPDELDGILVSCGPRSFLLFSAKDLLANDAKNLAQTSIQAIGILFIISLSA